MTSTLARLVLALAWSVVVAAPVLASHTTFSSSCMRFEADGNVFGPADGTLDFVDEFDNGSLGPDWAVEYGTGVETGGSVVLKSPGQDFFIDQSIYDLSVAETEQEVQNDAGNLTATSYWAPTLPALDAELSFLLYTDSVVPIQVAGFTLSNFSPEVAALQSGGGTLAGYAITESVVFQALGGSVVTNFHTMAIDPMDVTGPIVLRLTLDDTTNMLTCSFSLDGGATFQSPFPAMPVFSMTSAYKVLLGAGGVTSQNPPPPAPKITGLKRFRLRNPGDPAARDLFCKVKVRGDYSGLNFGFPADDGATLNIAVDGVTQCFHLPAAGWRSIGGGGTTGWRYRDPGGTGSPVKQMYIKVTGLTTTDLTKRILTSKAVLSGKLAQIDLVPTNPTLQADTRFHFVGHGADFCGSTAGGVVMRNDARTFLVGDSPAPSDCTIDACDP